MPPLTPEQVKIIRATAPVIKEHGTTVTSLFYKTVLEEYPSLNNVFNQTNQANNHQAKALAGSLYAYASHIDDLGALSPTVEKICYKHASLYIRPEHYNIVGEGLIRAMGNILGEAFTPEIKDAWEAAYWQLANIFIGRENQLYQDSKGWTDWRDFTISDKVKESSEITSIYLKPVDGQKLPEYLPGQYISLLTDVPSFGYQQSRQYSLSDAPRTDQYRISVKREAALTPEDRAGWISNILHSDKKIGDIVQLSHPAGDFFYNPETDSEAPIVLLSAGVGITPMISILNTLTSRKSNQPISFIHGARNTSVQAFGSHVRNLAAKNENVKAIFFVKNLSERDVVDRDYTHVGRLTLGKVSHANRQDLWLDDNRTKYFVCGPEGFMADVARGLKELGVDDSRIKLEVFGTGDIASEPTANGVAH
ncbi:Flavohemoprotein [Pseudocercospora fuligena]|uniref:nitric oxide dioxygenase n=1 Tax=Pseudocercospora fuligena TaxID=685502 RepID=A0A8H6RTY9_9PEZI|nr:Flavohemoprotein [Pseudocercospora fuligena]